MGALPQEEGTAAVFPVTTAVPAIILYTSPHREQGFGAFQVDKYDIVAARSKEEAVNWLLENFEDVNPAELFPEPVEILLDGSLNYVDNPDALIREVSYRNLIREAIQDTLEFPCIVATFEW